MMDDPKVKKFVEALAAASGWTQDDVENALQELVAAYRREALDGSCESCSADAEVMLPDGSVWCRACDAAAVRLGYDDGR